MTAERRLRSSWRRLGQSIDAFLQSVDSGPAQSIWPEIEIAPEENCFNVSLTHPIVLHGWPVRARTRRSWRLVIAVDAHFSVGKDDPAELLGYGTRVSYFGTKQPREQTFIRLNSFHYDMDVSGLCGHPVFHAQPYKGIAPEKLRDVRLFEGFAVAEPETSNPSIQNIRIPTAQLDVLSVCVMLLADHFLQDNDESADRAFRSFILGSAVSQSPLRAQQQQRMIEFFNKVQHGGMDIRGCHWYPYDTVPEPTGKL